MGDFFLEPMHITNTDDREVARLIEPKQQHPTAGAIGKG